MDDGFAYRVPRVLDDQISVGSIVRVPLAGRRIRGYVVGVEPPSPDLDPSSLKDVRSIASPIPVFGESMLPTLRWAADHYVAPIARILAKTGPPNLPKAGPPVEFPSIPASPGPVPKTSMAAAEGRSPGAVQILAGADWGEHIRGIVTPPIRAGRSVLVIAPTAIEAGRLANRLAAVFESRVVLATGEQDNATVTAAWSCAATHRGMVIVGTLRAIWWPVKDLSMIVLVEEERRGMKERQTPTVSVGDLARKRSMVEGPQLVLLGRMPTVRTMQEGIPIKRLQGRLWGLVEIVDRTDDPPGEGMFSRHAKVALAATLRRGGRVFLFTHRRGYAPAARCVGCRKLRICPACGSRPDSRPACPRCGVELGSCQTCGGDRFEPLGAAVGRVIQELERIVPGGVGDVDSGEQVTVGTERDLVGVAPVDLTLVVDADGLVRGTNYRATEDALALLARVASTVRRSGGRTMVQTADPSNPVYEALRRADPLPFLRDEIKARRRFLLPPCGEVMVVEVEGIKDRTVLDRALGHATVFGPAEKGGRLRWIVQGIDLQETKELLRATVGRLRDRGCRVRLDVDPREF